MLWPVPRQPEFEALFPAVPTDRLEPGIAILLAMPFLTVGGAEAIVSQYCRRLRERGGFRFIVVTTITPEPCQSDTTHWFEDSASEIFHLPRILDEARWPDFLAYLVRSRSVDILWLVGSAFVYSQLPRLKEGTPSLKIVDFLFNPIGHTGGFLRFSHLIDRVITEHQELKEWLMARGVGENAVCVVPNGVDLERYRPRARASWRAARGLPEAGAPRFVAAYVGRLSHEKAPDLFVQVADRLREHQGVEFILCGSGPMEAELRESIQERRLTETIHMLGVVETTKYLSCCDVLVVCSRLDGRPNVVMESLAMGVPVIASRVGGIPDMLEDGVNGILCDSGDIDGFASAVRRLADNPAYLHKLRLSTRGWAELHLDLNQSIGRIESIFRDLVKYSAETAATQPGLNR